MRLANYDNGSVPRAALQVGIGTDLIDLERAALLYGRDAAFAATLRDVHTALREGLALKPVAENAVDRIEQLRELGAPHAPKNLRLPVTVPHNLIIRGRK
ncbi:hypothetical protein ACFWIJ_00455, partial [Streptomyces sp. NPDC127079]|uniref:hypothetical protein n=1 Tax=Streptomyces sp. NPDC127079 TaxID=3347132 RepID=UPI003650E1B1